MPTVLGNQIIMGMDPGGTTGCSYVIRDGKTALYFTSETTTREELFDMIMSVRPTILIYERFATSGRVDPYRLWTVELCGSIYALAYALRLPVFRHTPTNRRPFMAQSLLKLQRKGRRFSAHEVDSQAHVLTWEYVTQHMGYEGTEYVPGEYFLKENGSVHYELMTAFKYPSA